MRHRNRIRGFLKYKKYRGLILTAAGKNLARQIAHRHRLLTDFLRLLGLDDRVIHHDVEGMEHHISPATLPRSKLLLSSCGDGRHCARDWKPLLRKALMRKKKISSQRPAIPVRALDFVMYNTKNIRRARAFYQKLFGLKRGEEWNDFWSEFATEPLTLSLNGTGHKRHPEWDWSGPACVALAVDDVRAAIGVCRSRRVKILIEPVETRVCWMAWIADPDGNRICLHSRKDGTAG